MTRGMRLAACALTIGALVLHCSKDNGAPPTSATPAAPSITTQPQSQAVDPGAPATFSVTAAGYPAPTYQWKKDGVDIPGATSASYTIPSAAVTDNGTYTVVITNSLGTVPSSGATLVVAPQPKAPTISVQPQSQTVEAGAAVTLTVTATGDPAPTYQWKKNGADITGQTSATLPLTPVQLSDAASYTVVVLNSKGMVTSSAAVLTVTSRIVARWTDTISVDTSGMTIPVKLVMIYKNDQTLVDTIDATVRILGLTVPNLYIRQGTWMALSSDSIVRTYTHCTMNGADTACTPVAETMSINIQANGTWPVTMYGHAAVFNKH